MGLQTLNPMKQFTVALPAVSFFLCSCMSPMTPLSTVTKTDWPKFMPNLEADLSESAVAAEMPADINIEAPPSSVAPQLAQWSGVWSGWAGQGRSVDVKLIVEKITASEVTMVVVRAMAGTSLLTQRLTARFEGGELRGVLTSGTSVTYRMRNLETVELCWRGSNGAWMAGVMSKSEGATNKSIERIATELIENGKAISLEMVLFKPSGNGPFPTLMFNHGSTGWGNDASLFKATWTSPALARFFNERGWLIAFPQRRGRGKSDGLYDEGMELDRSAYSARPEVSLPGVDRALDDMDEAVAWLKTRPEVDRGRMIIGGQSRGGILSVAFSGTRPAEFRGVINFVGGWMGEGAQASEAVNTKTFQRGAPFGRPTLWLHADNDPFYSLRHSRKNFDAFIAAGGVGSFHIVPIGAAQDGHHIVSVPSLWRTTVERYLADLNL